MVSSVRRFRYFAAATILVYLLLVYCLAHSILREDFISFYYAALTYQQGGDPYASLSIPQISPTVFLPYNLNPPFFLGLLSPLTLLTFTTASVVWTLLSLIVSAWGVNTCLTELYPHTLSTRYRLTALVLFFAFFPMILNTSIVQVGGFLVGLILGGYALYRKQHNVGAGILWGLAAAVKFFPGLLFFFVLLDKRWRVGASMMLTVVLATLWPLLTHHYHIYVDFTHLLRSVLWYGANWNASFYGFLFRLGVPHPFNRHEAVSQIIHLIHVVIFTVGIVWYLIAAKRSLVKKAHHEAFFLTLIMMLLLSPFGWIYYFPLLFVPMLYMGETIIRHNMPRLENILWHVSLWLIIIPVGYLTITPETPFWVRITFYSFNYYGLFMLLGVWVLQQRQPLRLPTDPLSDPLLFFKWPTIVGLAISMMLFLSHLFL